MPAKPLICSKRTQKLDTIQPTHQEPLENQPKEQPKFSGYKVLYSKSFFVMAQAGCKAISTNRALPGETLRVLFALLGSLEFDNYIHISQTELAKELGIDSPRVNKAMKLLETENIIERGAKRGVLISWRLNPTYGFKGEPSGKVRKVHTGVLRFTATGEPR